MTEFLVEMYLSPTDADAVEKLATCARAGAEELSGRGIPVRYRRSIFVAEEETCFVFYDAPSRDAARDAARFAKLRFVCIAAAVTSEADE